jgi:CBS domain-containing protein
MRFWSLLGKKLVSKKFHHAWILDFAITDEDEYGLITNVLVGLPGQKALWFPVSSIDLQQRVLIDPSTFACPLKTNLRLRRDLLFRPGFNILGKSTLYPIDFEINLKANHSYVSVIRFGLFYQSIPWSDYQPLGSSYHKLLKLHPIEVADMIQQLSIPRQAKILFKLNTQFSAFVLSEINSKRQAPILEKLDIPCAVELLSKMPRNHAANILRDVGEASRYVEKMESTIAIEIEKLLSYDPDTVGGLMDSEFIKLNQNITCKDAIEFLGSLSPSSENIYYLYVVDNEGIFKGVLSSRSLMISSPEVKLEQIMRKKLITIPETIRREKIAFIMSRYHLLALPVVDKQGRIVGVIKIHDVLESALEYPV